jgi:branched-subunit amino acid ABC-type transport system permease component
MIIAVSLAGILLAYLFLRRTEHGRPARATVPS